jgi:hypothetical protein
MQAFGDNQSTTIRSFQTRKNFSDGCEKAKQTMAVETLTPETHRSAFAKAHHLFGPEKPNKGEPQSQRKVKFHWFQNRGRLKIAIVHFNCCACEKADQEVIEWFSGRSEVGQVRV